MKTEFVTLLNNCNVFVPQIISKCLTMPRKRRFAETDSDDEFDEQRRPQRNAANERERARMRVLSKAFCRLKTTLPWVPADTKLSKLDTLRLATSYIAHLRAVLMDQPINNDYLHRHPLTLVSCFVTLVLCLDKIKN